MADPGDPLGSGGIPPGNDLIAAAQLLAGFVQLLGKLPRKAGGRQADRTALRQGIQPGCYGLQAFAPAPAEEQAAPQHHQQELHEIVADLKGVPYKDIDRVLEIVHLQADRKRKVGQYSLGMKQRLGIAMALLGSPRLLILDEPTNGLDPAGIQEMRALIHDMPDACGATVLISSHLLGEMEQIVSQVGIINHGQLLFEGPLAELQRHSRGNVVLRLLAPDRGAAVLRRYGLTPQPADNGCLLPTMEDARLAALVQDLAAEGAGVVGVERQTKNLEEIFLSLTNTQTGKEVC